MKFHLSSKVNCKVFLQKTWKHFCQKREKETHFYFSYYIFPLMLNGLKMLLWNLNAYSFPTSTYSMYRMESIDLNVFFTFQEKEENTLQKW